MSRMSPAPPLFAIAIIIAMMSLASPEPVSAVEPEPGLTLSWAKNILTIQGANLPGGALKVWYLEAFCRGGSTDRDWKETVIPHTTRLLEADPDGRRLTLRSTVSDGVIVDHEIRAGRDEVAFRLVARNPMDRPSAADWAQPCIRVDRFTGVEARRASEEYLPKCFIFLDGRLARLPTKPWATRARYIPGQVWCPTNVDRNDVNPRPLSSLVPSNGLIGCFSADESMILATAWEPYQELFQGVIVCLHSDLRIGGLAPGESKTIRGKIYLVKNDVDALVKRYEADFPEQARGHARRADEPGPDLVVASNGSGDFTTIQEALDSPPREGRRRVVILIKDGVYREKIRIDADCVTLRGQSRRGTRIEFPQFSVDFEKKPDAIGRAVINIRGDDVVLENLTAANTAPANSTRSNNPFARHAFTVSGRGDRTITVDCDLLSEGSDTVALWRGDTGRYYHARCHFRGGVDFLCPRGWCYVTDCSFDEVRRTAALWHDGSRARDQKLVVRRSTFTGVDGWYLGRHHHDAQFYLLDCTFSASMADRPLARHRYNEPQKDEALDRSNRWGERSYYHNCHREGGDFAWFGDNLASAEGAPTPDQITASWTYGGTWDPEARSAPTLTEIDSSGRELRLSFDEDVTVKGKPRVVLPQSGASAAYLRGSGTRVLVFEASAPIDRATTLTLEGGAIVASLATVRTRFVGPSLVLGASSNTGTP